MKVSKNSSTDSGTGHLPHSLGCRCSSNTYYDSTPFIYSTSARGHHFRVIQIITIVFLHLFTARARVGRFFFSVPSVSTQTPILTSSLKIRFFVLFWRSMSPSLQVSSSVYFSHHPRCKIRFMQSTFKLKLYHPQFAYRSSSFYRKVRVSY